MSDAKQVERFTEADSEKLVELLNFIATNATFERLDVKKVLQFTRLLNWSQTVLLPKVEAHRFEVLSVTPTPTARGKKA